MDATGTCPVDGTVVTKDVRMYPHFVKLKTPCPECGTPVPLEYRPGRKQAPALGVPA